MRPFSLLRKKAPAQEQVNEVEEEDVFEECISIKDPEIYEFLETLVEENPKAKILYEIAKKVIGTDDLVDRKLLLEKMPKPLQSLVGNLADAVDRFQATSKDVRNEVDRAWSKVLVCLGKLIEGIGKHLNIEAIEKQGKELVKASQAKLAAVKEIGSHTQALLNKRKQLKSQNLSK